ncbi:MAG: hypothetical protein JO089_07905, partial [Alphaproteobacteria bacterium]|nr:hypothetical protein [Alphaproteobacteria bacterium]
MTREKWIKFFAAVMIPLAVVWLLMPGSALHTGLSHVAAGAGSLETQNHLGYIYYHGKGVTKDVA